MATLPTHHTRGPASAWTYRWDVILTRSTDTAHIEEARCDIGDPDELAELILRTAYDPRILSYSYYRYTQLDLTAAPTQCPTCHEPFRDNPANQHITQCRCGGHLTYSCPICGTHEPYPHPAETCTYTPPAPTPPIRPPVPTPRL